MVFCQGASTEVEPMEMFKSIRTFLTSGVENSMLSPDTGAMPPAQFAGLEARLSAPAPVQTRVMPVEVTSPGKSSAWVRASQSPPMLVTYPVSRAAPSGPLSATERPKASASPKGTARVAEDNSVRSLGRRRNAAHSR